MHNPRTLDEYLSLVDEVLFELDELFACAEEEGDAENEFKALMPAYQQIARELKTLRTAIAEGRTQLGQGEELAFMPLVKKWKTLIPFAAELELLNLHYKRGLED
jgi:hypothetical protein